MCEPSNAKIQVDLTPLNKGTVECDARIAFNSLDQPETINIVINDLNAEQINHFCRATLAVGDVFGTDTFTGALDTGEHVTGQLAFIKGVGFGAKAAELECYLGGVFRDSSQSPTGKGRWAFGLANYRIHIGDIWTELPPHPNCVTPEVAEDIKSLIGEWHEAFGDREAAKDAVSTPTEVKVLHGKKRNNRIVFPFAGRDWTLDDDLFGRWPKDDSKISEPVRSGSLSTEQLDGDFVGVLQQSADDIADLLSLALGRDIKWVTFASQLEDGSLQAIQYRKPGLLAFNQNGSHLADNWEFGNLKQFITSGEKSLTTDRDWWSVTIRLLTQARGSKYIEVKCSLLNTLLDRISSKILGDANSPEIDAALDERVDVKDFRTTLHYILLSLSPKWERSRTDALCGTMKDWNTKPSFSKKILRSCEKMGIPAISGKKLGFRHVVIHDGEMHSDLKTSEDRVQYFLEVEMVVLLLLIRMLGFDGYIYLQSNAPNPEKVSAFLVENLEQNVGK